MSATFELNLTRQNHDFLLDFNRELLLSLFEQAKTKKWSLGGVRFTGLSYDMIEAVEEVLGESRPDEGVEFPAGEFAPQANVGPLA